MALTHQTVPGLSQDNISVPEGHSGGPGFHGQLLSTPTFLSLDRRAEAAWEEHTFRNRRKLSKSLLSKRAGALAHIVPGESQVQPRAHTQETLLPAQHSDTGSARLQLTRDSSMTQTGLVVNRGQDFRNHTSGVSHPPETYNKAWGQETTLCCYHPSSPEREPGALYTTQGTSSATSLTLPSCLLKRST